MSYEQHTIFLKECPCAAPAFSWTAHTAQGQTLKAAIVDMQIGAGTSPMASYVAFTRVKKMEDLLIFRPFDRNLFCQGNLEGPELLLKVLRGEHVDWEAVARRRCRMPRLMRQQVMRGMPRACACALLSHWLERMTGAGSRVRAG